MLFSVTTENQFGQELSIDRQCIFKKNIKAVLISEVSAISTDFNSRFFQLSEGATMDASYVQELDGIIKEARTIANHLKQKRENLKQRFTVIANSLQS